MNTTNYGIIELLKYEWSGAAQTARTVARKVVAPMQSHDTPTHNSIPERRRPYWSDEQQCYLVPLAKGGHALVSAEDVHLVRGSKWFIRSESNRYAVATIDGESVAMHRLIMHVPPGMIVDHINHDGLDNRRSNLRVATRSQNQWNRKGPNAGSTSRYLGVSWDRERGKWKAQAAVGGVNYYIGRFRSEAEAAKARDQFVLSHHGEFSKLNFPAIGLGDSDTGETA